MNRADIIPADPAHIPHLAARMRQADRDECWAWAQHGPADAFRVSLDAAVLAWTGLIDGEPACMFGVGADGLLSPVGRPWLLGTSALDQMPRTFARLSVGALARIRGSYPVLHNYTDARHVRAHAWLRWLGFRLGEPRPMGPLGLPFRPFVLGDYRRV